ncbi:MAG: DinB family protein [Thermoanaerobaculia bacterium]
MTRSDAFDGLQGELDAALARARRLLDETDGRCFTVRPKVSSWSAAECLGHLSVSTELFLPVLRRAIDDAKERGLSSTARPRMDLLGRVLKWFLEPPIRSRFKTTAPFVPRSTRTKADSFSEFAGLQKRLAEMLGELQPLDTSKIKIVSPFDKRVRYNVFSAYHIIAAHQRRHLWQAEQAVASVRAVRQADQQLEMP